MSMLTDWLMVGMTSVYVIATIFICIYNAKSAKATREQVAESKRQFEESKRLETMPSLHLEIPAEQKPPLFVIELELCDGNATKTMYKIVRLKNLGNGSATNIKYTWKGNNNCNIICFDYQPINTIMHGDSYYFQLTINIDESVENISSGVLTWQYDDLIGNSYEQNVSLIFNEGDLVRCENNIPRYMGIIGYKLAEKRADIKTNGGKKSNA